MNCVFNDILVLRMAEDYYSSLESVTGIVSPEQRVQIEEIGAMLKEIGPIPADEEISAIKEAVKEIRDRSND